MALADICKHWPKLRIINLTCNGMHAALNTLIWMDVVNLLTNFLELRNLRIRTILIWNTDVTPEALSAVSRLPTLALQSLTLDFYNIDKRFLVALLSRCPALCFLQFRSYHNQGFID